MKKAFTLIEIMVSLAVFSMVMVVALGALLKIIDVNKRAQTIKTAVNNVNFALETMSREMRVGTNFTNPSTEDNFSMTFLGEKNTNDCVRKYAYRLNTTANTSTIQRAVNDPSGNNCTTNTGLTYVDVTSPNVYISGLSFDIKNTDKIPYVIIHVSGDVGLIEKTKSNFSIQTTVSQRLTN